MRRGDEARGGPPALISLAALLLAACAGSSRASSLHTSRQADSTRSAAPHARPQQESRAASAVDAEPVEDGTQDRAPPPSFSDEERERIAAMQRFVRTAAHKHVVDASLLNAVIWVESRFTTRARGKRGPRGLMQLMPRTARTLARELGRRYEPYSADFNIDAGALYLANMIALFDGDVALGLAAYNAGPARVRAAREAGEPISEQTQSYVRKVLAAQAAFQADEASQE